MTTVVEVRNAQKIQADEAAVQARRRVAMADRALEAARTRVNAVTTATASLQKLNVDLRRQLSAATMPADADRLLGLLERNLLEQRKANAAMAEASDALTQAEVDKTVSTARLTAAQAGSATAKAAQEAAQDQEDLFVDWRDALDGPPLGAVATNAGKVLTSPDYLDAKKRLEGLIGTEMLDLYRERVKTALAAAGRPGARTASVLDALAAAKTTNEKLAQRRDAAEAAFIRAMADAQATITALDRLATVEKQFAALASRAPVDSLDEATKVSILALATAVFRTASVAAAAEEKKVLAAERTLWAAQDTLDKKSLALVATKPAANPATDTSLATDRKAVTDAEAALKTATDALAPKKAAVDAWEIAVPADLFADIADFVTAEESVASLKAVDPAKVRTALKNAEATLAGILGEQATYERTIATMTAELEVRRALEAAAAGVAVARRLVQIRGDR